MSKIEVQLDQLGRRSSGLAGVEHSSRGHNGVGNRTVVSGQAKRVGIKTLGCKVNLFESELIGQTLQTDNWQVVPAKEEADLYLINTCTVTKEADRQARQEVRKAIKSNPDALVVVTGCYAQIDPQACAEIPGVDLVVGNDRKLDVHQLIPRLEKGDLPKVMVGDLDEHISLPDHVLGGYQAHTRAFVQIQQGCDQGCTFCIIHVARGPSRSLPPSLIKRQVQRLVLNGYAEIVICGVDLGSYGDDLKLNDQDGFKLVDLLKELLELECDPANPFRLRLSSIDPHHISDELIDLFDQQPRLCRQIHLSMQSGNTLILKRMKRRYTAEFMAQRIEALRQKVPELVISADVMVGFPTETEEQYQDTQDMLETLQVAYPHVFSYSARQGTPAARIPESKQVPMTERKSRNKRLREKGEKIKVKVLQRRVGQTAFVLKENRQLADGRIVCRSEDYLPSLLKADAIDDGVWTEVKYTKIEGDNLVAELV